MAPTDGRKLSEAVLIERRRRAVKMRLGGAMIAATAKLCEIGERTVWAATRAYERGGWAAVSVRHGHRPKGSERLLTLEQEREVQRLIRDHVPDTGAADQEQPLQLECDLHGHQQGQDALENLFWCTRCPHPD